MKPHPRLQPGASEIEQPLGPQQASDQPLRDHDLIARLGLSTSGFYKQKARGAYRFLELRPQIPDSPTLYSAVLVAKWLRGELPTPEPRFFRGARPRLVAKRPVGRPRKGNQPAAPGRAQAADQSGEFAVGAER